MGSGWANDRRIAIGRTPHDLTFDPASLPVLTFDLQGDLSQAELLKIAQGQVIPSLTNLDGVAAVDVVGGALTGADHARSC